MKNVVDLNTFTFTVIEVPDDYIQCSVCGVWKDPIAYRNTGEERQSRTNCEVCYNMPYEEMKVLKEETNLVFRESLYQTVLRRAKELNRETQRQNEKFASSIPVQELIEILQKLPADSRIAITQEGFYSECEFAEIFEEPEEIETINNTRIFAIGNSSQNY